MPAIRLPIFDQSLFQKPIGDQVRSLADMFMRYKRELEFLLNGALDEDNGVISADVIISNTIITENLYAEYGRIANLTVNELDTGWEKITNYLSSSTADVNYIHINDQKAEWITASTTGATTEHFEDKEGNPLYWTDDTYKGMGTKVTDYPVTVYVYTELTKATFSFDSVSGTYIPRIVLGAGTGTGDNGKGIIYKDTNDLHVGYRHSTSGDAIELIANNDGLRKSGGEGSVQLRNVAILAKGATIPDTVQDGDLVIQGYSSSDKREVTAAATLYVQVDGVAQPTFIRCTSSSGNYAVALPTDDGLEDGVELTIKNATSSAVISLTGSVDGYTSFTLQPKGCVHLRYNGTDWDLLSHFYGIN